jgi:hypothetical protein
MEAIQWAIGVLVMIQTAVIGFIGSRLWSHVVECRGAGEKVAAMWADVERMKRDIGTHDEGMRGAIHRIATHLTEIDMRLSLLERK